MSGILQADRLLIDIYDLYEREVMGWESEKVIEKEWDEIFSRVAKYLIVMDRNIAALRREKGPEKGPSL